MARPTLVIIGLLILVAVISASILTWYWKHGNTPHWVTRIVWWNMAANMAVLLGGGIYREYHRRKMSRES
jgi:cytochrome bd-type quinol oxidase subunit 1